MDFSTVLYSVIVIYVLFCNAQKEKLPDLQSLDLFKNHMDISSLLPDTLVSKSSIPSSLKSKTENSLTAKNTTKTNVENQKVFEGAATGNEVTGTKDNMSIDLQTDVVSLSAAKQGKHRAVFSIKNAEVAKHPPPVVYNTTEVHIPGTERMVISTTQTPSTISLLPDKDQIIKDVPQTRQIKKANDLEITGKVVHEFLPKNMWNDMKTHRNDISNTFKDSFNIAGSSIPLSDIFQQPWNTQSLIGSSYILPTEPLYPYSKRHLRKNILRARRKKQQAIRNQNENPTIEQLTNLLKRENTLLNIALGLFGTDKSQFNDAWLRRKRKCPYKVNPGDNTFFKELVKDSGWIKRRCALGTAYDPKTCECSINIGYQPEKCLPEVTMNFNNGVVADQSGNEIPAGVEGVVSLSDLAFFSGASRIVLWRYTNFDFQKSITLHFRFKSEADSRSVPHPLITNCGTGHEEPSFGIILNGFSDMLTLFVKTTTSEIKVLTFKINPREWNDVLYSYDGEHLTGKVNGLEKRESVNGNIEIRSAELVIGHCERYGWFKGFLDDVKIYSCVPKEV